MNKNNLALGVYLIAFVLSLGGCINNHNTPTSARERVEKEKDTYKGRYGEPKVTFTTDQQGHLQVTITTKRLKITPVTTKDVGNYHKYLFGDSTVMEKFASGNIRDKEKTKTIITNWEGRWQKKNRFLD